MSLYRQQSEEWRVRTLEELSVD